MLKKYLNELAISNGYSSVKDFLYDYRMIKLITVKVPMHTKIDFLKLIVKNNRK